MAAILDTPIIVEEYGGADAQLTRDQDHPDWLRFTNVPTSRLNSQVLWLREKSLFDALRVLYPEQFEAKGLTSKPF